MMMVGYNDDNEEVMKVKDTDEIENEDGKVNEEIDFNNKTFGKPVKHCDNKEVKNIT